MSIYNHRPKGVHLYKIGDMIVYPAVGGERTSLIEDLGVDWYGDLWYDVLDVGDGQQKRLWAHIIDHRLGVRKVA